MRVGPFGTTDLGEQLRGRGVDTLVLAGISTGGVVLSAVRDAHGRDYRLFVLADATADPDAEVHAALIEKVLPRQAEVIEVADLQGLLGYERDAPLPPPIRHGAPVPSSTSAGGRKGRAHLRGRERLGRPGAPARAAGFGAGRSFT